MHASHVVAAVESLEMVVVQAIFQKKCDVTYRYLRFIINAKDVMIVNILNFYALIFSPFIKMTSIKNGMKYST